MRKLQVFNWGTFEGLHTIPISEKGHLIIGRSGSGKSSLLDAITALIVPKKWQEFNAAAIKGEKGKHDRSFVSYIRGAWGEQSNEEGEIATQYLRTSTTWSALALEYSNRQGKTVSLIHVLVIKGASLRETDIRHIYFVANRPFDIGQELKDFPPQLDVRKLKQSFADVRMFDDFSKYSEHFMQKFSIRSENALKLLQKAAAIKDLGAKDLNGFLREFMLDKPETYEVSERLVDGFLELESAHTEVVDARRQIEHLTPSEDAYSKYIDNQQELVRLSSLETATDAYKVRQEKRLIEECIEQLKTQDTGLAGQEAQQQQVVDDIYRQVVLYEEEHRAKGGAKIQELEQAIRNAEKERDQRAIKKRQAEEACVKFGRKFPDTSQDYAQLIAEAKEVLDTRKSIFDKDNETLVSVMNTWAEKTKERSGIISELDALKRSQSNIDPRVLRLRDQIVAALNLPEDSLPFIGELIEVRKEAADWHGAIERLLRGFALSILVSEDLYRKVSDYINRTFLAGQIVYYRALSHGVTFSRELDSRSVISKLTIKENIHKPWLKSELAKRFDYVCATDMSEFRAAEYSLTKEGQIKQGENKHVKDDRKRIDDQLAWVLGSDNTGKKRLYEGALKTLDREIADLAKQKGQLKRNLETLQERILGCQALVNISWEEVDIISSYERVRALMQTRDELRAASSTTLKELEDKIRQSKEKRASEETNLNNIKASRIAIAKEFASLEIRLTRVVSDISAMPLSADKEEALAERFTAVRDRLTLSTLDNVTGKVSGQIKNEILTLTEDQAELKGAMEKSFNDFLREFSRFRGDLKAEIGYASDFMNILDKLRKDGLPKVEDKFFKMLEEQSENNISALSNHIKEGRKLIRVRMEEVNSVLETAPYNPDTYLKIVVNDRHLPQIREFQAEISKALDKSWLTTREDAEKRFLIFKNLVTRLKSEDKADILWKNQVLDVRQHVEFIGKEYDLSTKQEIQVHRAGTGKSGGQREKLSATCVAAALRYQLGGEDSELPMYSPIIIDEALANSDSNYMEAIINIFMTFGFQLVLATPGKGVMTIEPYIGGATVIDIEEQKYSSALQISYNEELKKLDVPLGTLIHG